MIGPTCPRCDRIHSAGDVVALGKFSPADMRTYMVTPDGPVFASREEAQAHLCAQRTPARPSAPVEPALVSDGQVGGS